MPKYIEWAPIIRMCNKLKDKLVNISVGDDYSMYSSSAKHIDEICDILTQTLSALNTLRRTIAVPTSLKSDASITMGVYSKWVDNLDLSSFDDAAVRDVADLIKMWFKKRFDPESGLKYNCAYIGNYIDAILIVAGDYAQHNSLDEFYTLFLSELTKIGKPGEIQYPLPKFINSKKNISTISVDSVKFEFYIKESLYTAKFLPDLRDSIRIKYCEYWGEIQSYEQILRKV